MNTEPTESPDASEGDTNLTVERRQHIASHLSRDTRDLLARDEAVYMRQSLSTPCMNALRGAQGSEIIDADGRRLLDFHGNSVHQVGHGHPKVVEAIKRQLDDLPFCPRRYTNEPAVRLAEELIAAAGPGVGGRGWKVLLAPGGALAMGMALKTLRLATGRFKTVSMWGSFHGASLDAISVGGEAIFRAGLGPLLPGAEHVPACAPSACGLGCGGSCSLACVGAVEEVLRREGDAAAVIGEPVRCTTIDVPPEAYWRRVRAACDRHGALLVFDEIPLGLGRTGRMFAFEHFGVVPDILVLGKGLGGGIFPQAAMLARADLDVGHATALGHYTHEKSPVGATAALATLEVLREEGLVERSREMGAWWCDRLRERLMPTGVVAEVRGLGLLVGVELRLGDAAATRALTDRVLHRALRGRAGGVVGLNFKVSDGRVLTLTPPLNVTREDLNEATEILVESIKDSLRD
jgi:4-aminobutyrate aminotransferase